MFYQAFNSLTETLGCTHCPQKAPEVGFDLEPHLGSLEKERMASYAVEMLEWDNSVRDVHGYF